MTNNFTSKLSGIVRITLSVLVAGSFAAVVPQRAALACGGCFAPPPPPGAVFSVTDHRMVISVSATQTTLWDQFSYAGKPAEFAWILPIRSGPDVRVALADDNFLTMLNNLSAPSMSSGLSAPTRQCGSCLPPYQERTYCAYDEFGNSRFGHGSADAAAARQDAASSADVPSVVIHRSEAIGPYQVTVLGGNDAAAVRGWLTMNGYNISASIEPVLMNYIDMRMDFVAVRLRGTAGIQRMAPLKITMPGMQAVLPLQMVAAGVSEKVGLLLMVLGNSRYEAANFPNFVVENANLTYDFSARTDGMAAFRAESRRLDQIAGGGWQTESALPQDRSQLERFARAYPQSPPGPDGMSASVQADVITALAGIDGPLMLTRLRAELPTSALTRDLRLQASAANTLSSRYEFGAALNTPVPAACEPLRCAENWGRIETDGAINDPFNRVVAPSSTFPGRYTAGSLPAYSPRVTRVEPARLPPIREQCNSVGRAVAQPTGVGGGGCAVGAVSKSRSTSCMFAFGLVLCASAASRRKRA